MSRTIRSIAGALLFDCPRFIRCVSTRKGWVAMRNRRDTVSRTPARRGVRCEWEHTRPLHLCAVFPSTGTLLWRRAFGEFPLRFADRPARASEPDVSFLIGHRGESRLPALLTVLRAIAAQREVCVEAVVVEQDSEPRVRDRLPDWVRYAFDRVPEGAAYNRARAINHAARQARGRVLMPHDGDLLAPDLYAAEHFRCIDNGSDVASLKRFIFYVARLPSESPADIERLVSRGRPGLDMVLQNATGGGSVAVTREGFERIGGMDEDFVGWGGEDVEFWGRAITLRTVDYGYLPLAHLWHPPQPRKASGDRNNALMAERCALPPAERIARLRARAARAVGAAQP